MKYFLKFLGRFLIFFIFTYGLTALLSGTVKPWLWDNDVKTASAILWMVGLFISGFYYVIIKTAQNLMEEGVKKVQTIEKAAEQLGSQKPEQQMDFSLKDLEKSEVRTFGGPFEDDIYYFIPSGNKDHYLIVFESAHEEYSIDKKTTAQIKEMYKIDL